MSDTASVRTTSRASTFMSRPHIAPMGPRTRQSSLRVSRVLDSAASPPSTSSLDLGEFGGRSASTGSEDPPPSPMSSTMSGSVSARKSLPPLTEDAVAEEPSTPPPERTAPAYSHEPELPPRASSSRNDELETPPTSSRIHTPDMAAKVVVTASPLPSLKLSPPPAIKFETSPVPWKGLPMEAAIWTVDSAELQNTVSRAIRASAKESFIRLLTAENLDTVLPIELERLDVLKAMKQSRYKFLVHRRTMLFHALNSTALGQQKDGEDGVTVVARLTSQLGDTIGECDQHLEEVININDQIAQINKLIDVHWGSALAIALRKLNGSYTRRTNDLIEAKERIKQLQAELNDAWKEAEKMAGELDDYEAAIVADDAEAIIEVAEIVPVPKSPTLNRRLSMPMSPTLVAFTPKSPSPASPGSATSPTSPHFAFPPNPQVHLKAKEAEAEDVPDTVSIRSTRSTRSAKSNRSQRSAWTTESNHTVSLQAARKRSQRASQGNLRLNTAHGRKQSSSRSKTPYEEQPPVPELPLQFSSFSSRGHVMHSAANASSIFMHSESSASPRLLRRQSLDSVCTSATGRAPVASSDTPKRRAADDLYVRLKSQKPDTSDIQVVPRTPPLAQNFATMYHTYTSPPPMSIPHTAKGPSTAKTTKNIPSMWMNVDAIKPPASQVASTATASSNKKSLSSSERTTESQSTGASTSTGAGGGTSGAGSGLLNRQGSLRSATYSKIRGLTKRYSVSLPLFNTKPVAPKVAPRKSG